MKYKIKKFESFNNDVFSFLSDFQNSKFKRMIGRESNGKKVSNMTHDIDMIKNDHRYDVTYRFLKSLYDDGHGLKSIIKINQLPITYPVLRKLMREIMGIKLRKYNDITDTLRKKRSDKVKLEHTNGSGWFSDKVIRKSNRGIQGYYFNKSLNKKVWIRSTYEYIYALWLDNNGYTWDVEYKSYRLDDGSLYKPDFFIFDKDGKLYKIVEVKGYWKNRSYKFNKLKKQLEDDNIECEIINDDEILNYSNEKIKNITQTWKNLK